MEPENRPLIGITAIGPTELPFTTAHTDAFISSPQTYVDCVLKAGGLPILIPPVGAAQDALVARLDGIIFSGGTDIHPQHYGGQHDHPELKTPDEGRDDFDLGLMQVALAHKTLPILAICRGVQVLNVALGGTLLEHLPDHLDDDVHRGDDGLWTEHDIQLDRDSRLAAIIGSHQVHTVSGHHQALGNVADGLVTVARSADGIVEAVELTDHPWCIGVQWHPEESAARDPGQQRIFEALVVQSGLNGN